MAFRGNLPFTRIRIDENNRSISRSGCLGGRPGVVGSAGDNGSAISGSLILDGSQRVDQVLLWLARVITRS